MYRNSSHPAQSLSTRAIALAAIVTVTGLTMNTSAATYVYGSVVSATDNWSTGTNWDSTPVSASTTTLRFGGTDAAAAAISVSGTVISSSNDITGNFALNQFILSYRGTAAATAPTVTVAGNPLEFVDDGATTPTMLLRANANTSTTTAYKPVTTVSNNLILNSNALTITANTNNNGGTSSPVVNVTGTLTYASAGLHTLTFAGNAASGSNIGGTALFSGKISSSGVGAGNATSVIKNGAGHWRLSGANDYTGTTMINAGVLEATTAGGLGTGDVTVASGSVVGLTGAGTYTNNISIAGNGVSITPSTVSATVGALWLGKDAVLSGTVTLAADSRISALGGPTSEFATISGKITGNYALQFGTGAGTQTRTMIISNPLNDWSGNTTLSGGANSGGSVAMRLGASEVIPHGAGKGNLTLSASNSATIDLYGNNETINGLNASGGSVTAARTITNSVSGSPVVFTLGAGDANGYYAYGITGGSALALTKVGSGTQTLSGVISYTGTTTVAGGVLDIGFTDVATSNTNAPQNVLSASTPLVLNGGTLRVTERVDAVAYSESLTTTAVSSGTAFSLTVADPSGLRVGQTVSGTNIPNTRYISRISGTTVVISGTGAVTAGTDTVNFDAEVFASTQNFASLDLAASSTLDFGLAGDSTTIRFGAVTQSAPGTVLSIANWSGIVDVGGGTERLLFTGSPTDFSSVFSQSEVNFIGYTAGYQLIDLGGSYEVVPGAVPEPASLSVLALGGLGLLSRRLRRR